MSLELDLSKYGISGAAEIVHNPSYEELYAEETKANLEGYDKGQKTELDAVNVMTGVYTGRSPKDKFIVKDSTSEANFWWTTDEFKNDNKLVFDASGKLTKMQDASGNTLTVTYNGIRVTKVTDGAGRAAPPSQTGKDRKRPSASTPSGALCLPMTAWAARYPPGTCRGTAGATGCEAVQRCRRRWCSC